MSGYPKHFCAFQDNDSNIVNKCLWFDWLIEESESCWLVQFFWSLDPRVFQNLLLSKGSTTLNRADGRAIVSHYSFSVLKKWMCSYPNDSIIVINYSARVIYTIWQSLKGFFLFWWVNVIHTSLTHSHIVYSPPTHSNTCPTHSYTHHNPLIYSSTTHTPINYTHTTLTPLTHSIITHANPTINHMPFTHLSPT